jgi:basic amino acid/polyamine antiporter, APA family
MALPPSDDARVSGEHRLPRSLGLWSAIALVIGSVIGSGIFRSPAGVANRLPGAGPMLLVWVMGGVFALCGVLTLAEIASAYPRTGGLYVFLREGWGRLAAFLFGWSELVIIRAAALGAISTTFAEYFLRVMGFDPAVAPYDAWAHYLAALAIGLTAIFNIVGVRLGSAVQIVTTVAKYGGLLLIVLLAFAIGLPRTGGHFTPAFPPGSITVGAFGLALVSALWAYDGWADLSFIGGEVRDPRRTLPRALIGGALAVMAIYILANVAYLSVLSVDEMRTSRLVAADVAQRLVGTGGARLVAIIVMLSTFGALNGALMTTPRIFFAMADDGMLFRRIASVHPTFRTPWAAISLAACLGIVFVLLRTFEQLADTFVTAILPFYGLGVATIFVLRRRGSVQGTAYDPGFRTPGYPLVPALFVASVVYLLVNAVLDPVSGMDTLKVMGGILVGIPVYYLTVGRRGRTVVARDVG